MSERGRVLWWVPPIAVALCVLLGAVVGAGTNMVNAHVSPGYYQDVMFWDPGDVDVPRAAVAQGAFEGGILGLLFGLVVSITAAASARLRCPFPLMAKTVLRTVLVALACWAVGGLAGVAFAAAEPRAFRSTFVRGPGVPTMDWLLRFAWVGGSIWGAYASAVIGGIYASVSLHRRWNARSQAERTGFPVSPLVQPVAASPLRPEVAGHSGHA